MGGPNPNTWGDCVRLPENAAGVLAVRRLARAVADPGRPAGPSPLVLHGPPGTGKSLLVRTLMTKLSAGLTGRSLPARDLPTDGDDGELGDLAAADVLAVEDIHHLPARSVADICRLLDVRVNRRRPTVVTASAGPAELTHLPRRLTSRLTGGLVVPLEPLSAAGRRVLVERHAARRAVALTPDALDWLAARPTGGGIRPLLGAVERLAVLARGGPAALGPADIERYLEAVDGTDGADGPGGVAAIVGRVAAAYRVSSHDLLSASRLRSVVVPRHVAMYLAREVVKLSYPKIAAAFGGRDHTTVLHACRRVAALVALDPETDRLVRRLRAELC